MVVVVVVVGDGGDGGRVGGGDGGDGVCMCGQFFPMGLLHHVYLLHIHVYIWTHIVSA